MKPILRAAQALPAAKNCHQSFELSNGEALSTSTTTIIIRVIVVVRRLGDQCAHANRLKLVACRRRRRGGGGGCDVMALLPAAFSNCLLPLALARFAAAAPPRRHPYPIV